MSKQPRNLRDRSDIAVDAVSKLVEALQHNQNVALAELRLSAIDARRGDVEKDVERTAEMIEALQQRLVEMQGEMERLAASREEVHSWLEANPRFDSAPLEVSLNSAVAASASAGGHEAAINAEPVPEALSATEELRQVFERADVESPLTSSAVLPTAAQETAPASLDAPEPLAADDLDDMPGFGDPELIYGGVDEVEGFDTLSAGNDQIVDGLDGQVPGFDDDLPSAQETPKQVAGGEFNFGF
ncbi:hypothetical protein [Pseudomonas aeruginosa]|uniref:hypothetical protein n=1 Tax=Pseudomonas aeruginosa TaxID=287 RepID=UPI001D265AF1|nr:hypothetical protein [Pseudomonas aeruginosa]MBN0175243.1 hypothetical protein [Pseudomonas aeruginosa]MDS9628931.1 hypothetical protein [Pseudomonas aeruginosa]